MKQYLDLLQAIEERGTVKPAARENMPSTKSLFGYQFRHDLSQGFPALTTKKLYWKGVVIELLWFLRGDTNIKYLVDNNVNIWNEDAYNFYQKKLKEIGIYDLPDDLLFHEPNGNFRNFTFEEFIDIIKSDKQPVCYGYKLGDCGFQYGKVWRDWENLNDKDRPFLASPHEKCDNVDQIKNLIKSLINTPDSRRHIVSAVDPVNDAKLALYWCHAMFQFNCRPINTHSNQWKRYEILEKRYKGDWDKLKEKYKDDSRINWLGFRKFSPIDANYLCDLEGIPTYYLDCQLYQRSADVVLGVPFNIASYALLTHILAEITNMCVGEFIHSFGDVHIYENHKEAVQEQLSRTPTELPKLRINSEFWGFASSKDSDDGVYDFTQDFSSETLTYFFKGLQIEDFQLENYKPQVAIKAELSTGLKK